MRVKKIQIIIPPQTLIRNEIPRGNIPYGQLILATLLERAGYEVNIVDGRFKDEVPEPRRYNFNTTQGESLENIIEKIEKFSPDVIGVACLGTYQWNYAEKVIKAVKEEYSKKVPILLGGIHASFAANEILELPIGKYITTIVRGSSIDTVIATLKKLERGEEPSKITEFKILNMEEVPPLNFDLLEENKLKKVYGHPFLSAHGPQKGEKTANYILSIGCPMACEYCAASYMHGRKITKKKIEHIEEDFKKLSSLGFDEINFVDDQFALLPDEYANKVLELASKYFKYIFLDGGIYNPAMTEKKAKMYRDLGVYGCYLATETPDPTTMKKYKKFKSKEQYLEHLYKVTSILNENDILFYTSAILAMPNHNKEFIDTAAEFQAWLRERGSAFAGFPTLIIFPGTPNYYRYKDLLKKEKWWANNSDYYSYSLYMPETLFDIEDMNAREVMAYVRKIHESLNGKVPSLPSSAWNVDKNKYKTYYGIV